MKRYLVTTKRALYNAIVVEAESEQDARDLTGGARIIDENETDSWADEFVSIVQVADDCDMAELP